MPRVKQFEEQVVLEKALELFWYRGYHFTSMQDLVDELGINRGSLYGTFGGKKDLFYKALSHHLKANIDFLTSYIEQQDDVIEGIRQFFYMVNDEAFADELLTIYRNPATSSPTIPTACSGYCSAF